MAKEATKTTEVIENIPSENLKTVMVAPTLVPVSETAAILHLIERAARDSTIDIDKLQRLLDMRAQIEARAEEKSFDVAMAHAQSEMHAVVADKENQHTRSKYASYFALDKAIRSIYTKYGLYPTFNQGDIVSEGVIRITCRVGHIGGHARAYHIDMPADGASAKGAAMMTKTHAIGSAITYGRRYLLQMIFNLVIGGESEDDDGVTAGGVFITGEQSQQLMEMLDETGSNIGKFIEFFGITDVGRLPAKRYNDAFNLLQNKKKTVVPKVKESAE